MTEHGNAVFGGDAYSSEWHEVAVKERGLKNIPTTADALPAFREESVKKLFADTGVLSPVELESRFEVYAAVCTVYRSQSQTGYRYGKNIDLPSGHELPVRTR